MKVFIFIAALLAGTVSFAKAKGVLEFRITQATFADAHVPHPGMGKLVLNYDKSLVTLTVNQISRCPAGRVCAAVMPHPVVVELPVVSVKKDSCGIRHVVAQEDLRPADGVFAQMTVTDPTSMTCKSAVAVMPKATYQTIYVDRMTGQSVHDESVMTLSSSSVRVLSEDDEAMLETSLAPPIMIKLVRGSGFSPKPTLQTLYIDVTGRVMNAVQDLQAGKTTQTMLAQLSPEALAKLKEKVNSIEVDGKLIDEDEDQPMCTDAPSTSVVVKVERTEVTIYRHSGCHTFNHSSGYASQLYAIIAGFSNLAN